MKTCTINVTEDHIRRARRYAKDRRDGSNCPIALAIHEQTPFKRACVAVGLGIYQTVKGFWSHHVLLENLPPPLLAFVLHFDGQANECPCSLKDRDVVKPFSFTVELPE